MSVTNLLNTGGISLAQTEQIVDELGLAEGVYFNPYPYLTFSSNDSFTLQTYNNQVSWDGVLEYCLSDPNGLNWSQWDGTTLTSGNNNCNYVIFYNREAAQKRLSELQAEADTFHKKSNDI